jgi:hypothetical protein
MTDEERGKLMMQEALDILSMTNLRVFVIPKLDEDCMLPDNLLTRDSLLLVYGFDLPVPIPDLMVTEMGISGTLAFAGKGFETFIPWSAVDYIEDELTRKVYDGHRKRSTSTKKLKLPPATTGGTVVSLIDYKRRKGIK